MEISGDTTISHSGKVVSYRAIYELTGNTGSWNGAVLLRHGKWHQLKGGKLVNVAHDTIAPATVQSLIDELERLDFDKLNENAS